MMRQFAIISGVCFLGYVISYCLPFTFPSSVMALFVLFIFLSLGWIKENSIKQTSDFFLKNMAFFYVAPSISILEYLAELKNSIVAIFVISIVSAILTFMVTAYTAVFVKWIIQRRRADHD